MTDSIVIDTSVVMSWCFQDEANLYADNVLDSMESQKALVPSIWPLEVGNVLLVAERRKRLSETDSARFLSLISQLPIVVEPESPERMLAEILSLARKHGLSSYDASYLDLAIREGLPIATMDKALIRAAQNADVKIF